MDKGLNIDTRQGYLGLALTFANRHALATQALDLYIAQCDVAGRDPRSIANSIAKEVRSTINWSEVDKATTWAEAAGNHLILYPDAAFPALLRQTPDSPRVIFAKGQIDQLSCPQVAMVGSRRATHLGLSNAHDIAEMISSAGFTVTSGMALGIDAACHRAALDAGASTIAVLGSGVEVTYPKRHEHLARQIAENGVLLSEFPLWASPKPYHFPRRNRIISGLSIAVIVVEAARQSGTLSTATHAANQGRDVFAVPGTIRAPSAAGCNLLIDQGAQIIFDLNVLVESLKRTANLYFPGAKWQSIDRKLPTAQLAPRGAKENSLSALEKRILDFCGHEGVSFDELVALSGLTTSKLSSILSALELSGHVASQAGDAYLKTR
ncbi:MAG: DNA-processing protein DprA [Pseudomonadota bacterium]